jgi:hypothetical protein
LKKYGLICIISVFLSLCLTAIILSQFPALAQNFKINLIHRQFIWKPFSAAILSQNDSQLNIFVLTDHTKKLWNRAYLPIKINATENSSLHFNLEYATLSYLGNATFMAEVRDNLTSEVLWSSRLNYTSGQFTNTTFILPTTVLNKAVEFRLVIITTERAQHSLDVKRATLTII